jgi:hypothetical protein
MAAIVSHLQDFVKDFLAGSSTRLAESSQDVVR